jgi:DNA-binding response OmpR family regulator
MSVFGKWRKAATSAEKRDLVSVDSGQASLETSKVRKILVVDDDAVVLKVFVMKLRACGFEVLTATEGAPAVSLARQQRPDLIVLDVNFPENVGNSGLPWNGFSIMHWMQRLHEVSSIPIIVMTSGHSVNFRDKAFAAGAVAFFEKPMPFHALLMAINRALRQPDMVQSKP